MRGFGLAVMELGGGRAKPTDSVDPAVGLIEVEGVGFRTGPQRPIARILARSEEDADRAERLLLDAIDVVDDIPTSGPTIAEHRAMADAEVGA